MKICVISSTVLPCPPPGYGGLEQIVWLVAGGLARRGHEVLLVAPNGSTVPPGVELHGTTLRELEGQAYSGYWQKLPSYDVIIDHSWEKWAYILKVEGKLGAPVLGVCHAPINTMYASAPPILHPCLVAISQDQADHVSEHLGVTARVAYNGCFDGSTLLSLEGGRSERLDSFVGRRGRERVLSWNQDTSKMEFTNVSEWLELNPKNEFAVRMTTRSGCILTSTPDNDILTSRGWVPAGQLRMGDLVRGHKQALVSKRTRVCEAELRPLSPCQGNSPIAGTSSIFGVQYCQPIRAAEVASSHQSTVDERRGLHTQEDVAFKTLCGDCTGDSNAYQFCDPSASGGSRIQTSEVSSLRSSNQRKDAKVNAYSCGILGWIIRWGRAHYHLGKQQETEYISGISVGSSGRYFQQLPENHGVREETPEVRCLFGDACREEQRTQFGKGAAQHVSYDMYGDVRGSIVTSIDPVHDVEEGKSATCSCVCTQSASQELHRRLQRERNEVDVSCETGELSTWEELVSVERIPTPAKVFDLKTRTHTFVANGIVVHNCDLDFYKAKKDAKRIERYLFLGRMSRIKGPHIAVDLARRLRFELDLVGDDKITGEPELAQRMHMQAVHNIKYHGGVSRERAVEFFSTGKALLHMNQHFCLVPGQPVVVLDGLKNIEDISIGDSVLTIYGGFQKITNKFVRDYSGEVVRLMHSSTSSRLLMTKDHPLLVMRPPYCTKAVMICRPTLGCLDDCRRVAEENRDQITAYKNVLELSAAGVSMKEITERLSIPPTTAYYWKTGKTKLNPRDPNMPYCDRYEHTWASANDLQEGDYLVTPIPTAGPALSFVDIDLTDLWPKNRGLLGILDQLCGRIKVTPELLTVCGLYIAEGNENKGAIVFNFNIAETYLEGWVRAFVETMGRQVCVFERHDVNTRVVRFNASPLGTIFERWFGHTARNKRMPDWMFNLPPEQLIHVIKGMWHGDGCNSKRGNYEMLSYTTSSRTLAHQLWLSLLKFGIMSYLVEKKAAPKAKNAGQLMYNLNVCGDYAVKLSKLIDIGFEDRRRPTAWKGFSFIHNGFAYSRVSEISVEQYNGPVYNMTVEGNNSFVSQLVVHHNCEPFGLAPVESNACGLPVIAFDYGAMRETIVHGESGFLVKSVAEVEHLIKTNAVASIKPERCRESAARFGLKQMIDGYERLAKEALECPW